jgi:ribosomal-protein-alanine N-acetyltransferase
VNDVTVDLPYEISPMRVSDIAEIMEIERQSFSTPWTPDAYRYELRHNINAHYYVVRPRQPVPSDRVRDINNGWRYKLRWLFRSKEPSERPILGYIGYWLVAGEAHISTIAVHPDTRRRGIGELLIVHAIEDALVYNAEFITLEVRVSNQAAQQLYEKYGFERTGRRRSYYSDTREDAWIMTIVNLADAGFRTSFERNRRTLHYKLLQVETK